MSARWILGALFVLAANVASAAPWEWGTGLVTGQAYELVLRDGTYQNPVSRLTWPTPPTLVFDASVPFSWNAWTQTRVSMRTGLPLATGTIVDEDWDAGAWGNETLVYGRSQHTAFQTAFLEAAAEQELLLRSWTLAAGVKYRWTSWQAWNGTGRYEGSVSTYDAVFRGPVLDYQQQWILPYVGVGVSLPLSGGTLTPRLNLGPTTWGFDRDDHNYSSIVDENLPISTLAFLDNVQGGFFGEVSLEWAAPGWGVRWKAQGTWGATGSTTITYSWDAPTNYQVEPNAAGAWFWESSVTVFVRN